MRPGEMAGEPPVHQGVGAGLAGIAIQNGGLLHAFSAVPLDVLRQHERDMGGIGHRTHRITDCGAGRLRVRGEAEPGSRKTRGQQDRERPEAQTSACVNAHRDLLGGHITRPTASPDDLFLRRGGGPE